MTIPATRHLKDPHAQANTCHLTARHRRLRELPAASSLPGTCLTNGLAYGFQSPRILANAPLIERHPQLVLRQPVGLASIYHS
jgi:hypothetical protein